MTGTHGSPTAGELARDILALLRTLEEAAGVEWEAAPRARTWESERGVSGSRERADVTVSAALDEDRLALREAVARASRQVRQAHGLLNAALAPYRGRW